MSIGSKTVVFPSTVLLVDDEEIILQLLTEIFSQRGMSILTADTGEKALEIVEKTGIGCMLIDKNLPGMDGLSVIRRARELQPYCACIVMTAFSSTESAVQALRLGAMDYLEKPFEDLDLIAEKVDKAISNERAQFERNALMDRLRAFDAELQAKESEVGRSRTEVEMFELVLEARIREATDDLRRKAKLYKASAQRVADKMAEVRTATSALLGDVRGMDLEGGASTKLVEALEAIVAMTGEN